MTHLKFTLFIIVVVFHTASVAERLAMPLQEQTTAPLSKSGAQTLYSISKVAVNPDYHWESQEYVSIRINDLQAARDYGRISIHYNHFYSNLELDFANVLTPSGEIKAVKADAIQEKTGGSQDFYEDKTTLVFSLPDIAPGSILEFQYSRTSKQLAMPHFFADATTAFWYQPTVGGDGGRVDPVYRASYEVVIPEQIPLHIKPIGTDTPFTRINSPEGKTQYRWEWQDLPAMAVESMMPPSDETFPKIRVSTSRDWSTVDKWTWGLVAEKIIPSENVKAVARGLVTTNASRDEKIKAVYAYLQKNIRYVFAHLGRGGYEPHFADEVIQQGYGDCKDQTILAVALLRELGINATPSLAVTRRFGRPNMDLAGLYFDHMIVFIPGNEEHSEFWMDTTGDRALYPGVSNYLLDQPLLIIDGNGGRLTQLGGQLDGNMGELAMSYRINDNKERVVDVTTHVSGFFEQNLRNWWIHDSDRETTLRRMVEQVFPNANTALVSTTAINAENLWQPFSIKSQFNFGKAESNEEQLPTYGVGVGQVYRLFGGLQSMQAPGERKGRWFNDQKQTLSIRATMTGEKNQIPAVLQTGSSLNNSFYKLQQTGDSADNEYAIRIEMRIPAADYSADEYRKYYQSLTDLDQAGHWLVQFGSNPEKETAEELTARGNDQDLASQLILARLYLNQGQFEKALEPAKLAVELDPKSGESWYVLGLAQGYNALTDESMASFEKATSLGYSQ